MVLHLFLSLTCTLIQFMIFCTVWTVFIVGVFVVVRLILSAHLCSTTCNIIAFAIASSLMFQLATLYGNLSAARKMILDRGPPMDCMGLSGFTSMLSSHSCSEYYEALQSNIFWQLNVLHVSGTLLSNTLVLIGSLFGGAFGSFVQSFLSRLDWLLRIPVLIIIILCLLSTIFALFGYRFDLFYGLIRIDFAKQQVIRCSDNDWHRKEIMKKPKRMLVECIREETKPVLLVSELYQKAFYRKFE